MTISPVFDLCNKDAEVKKLLKQGNILKVFQFGNAPQNTEPPYAVWQNVGGVPINYLDGRPDMEDRLIQIDAYATTQQGARDVINAIEYALEQDAYILGYNNEMLEADTNLWRVSIDVEFYNTRS